MTKRIAVVLLILIFFSKCAYAADFKYIEVFDPKQNKVIKVIQLNDEFQKLATGYLQGIYSIYGKLEPFPDNGYAVKIPLDPAVKVNKGILLNSLVNEIYVIIPEDGPLFMAVFENENKLMCFCFEGDKNLLMKKLDIKFTNPK
jgi:hypothetical protein